MDNEHVPICNVKRTRPSGGIGEAGTFDGSDEIVPARSISQNKETSEPFKEGGLQNTTTEDQKHCFSLMLKRLLSVRFLLREDLVQSPRLIVVAARNLKFKLTRQS